MNAITDTPQEADGFILSISRQWILELAALGKTPEEVRALAEHLFRAQNPEPQYQFSTAVLTKLDKTAARVLKQLGAEQAATDHIEELITAERPKPVHRLFRVVGLGTAVLCTTMLVPLVLVASFGVEESLLIDRVTETPLLALTYGVAPLGGVVAAHGLRDTFQTDRARRWFDRTIFVAAIATFGAWAHQFGPVFLSDVLSGGFGTEVAEKTSLSEWYALHLGLEFLGGSAAYIAATHLLTYGAHKVAQVSAKASALKDLLSQRSEDALTLAQQRDALAAAPHHYAAALQAFQDRVVLKVEMAQRFLAAKTATDSVNALIALKRDWQSFEEETNV